MCLLEVNWLCLCISICAWLQRHHFCRREKWWCSGFGCGWIVPVYSFWEVMDHLFERQRREWFLGWNSWKSWCCSSRSCFVWYLWGCFCVYLLQIFVLGWGPPFQWWKTENQSNLGPFQGVCHLVSTIYPYSHSQKPNWPRPPSVKPISISLLVLPLSISCLLTLTFLL